MASIKGRVDTFEDVLQIVGDDGPFQTRFNIIFNLIAGFVITMPYLNILLALLAPDHWCSVPGRNLTDLTLDEWKNLTLPVELDPNGRVTYNSCKMYNLTGVDISAIEEMDISEKQTNVVDCQHGWQYNRTWYKNTIPIQEDWVCEKELRVANTFTFLRIGELCGNILAGVFTDTLGRKPMFQVGVITLVVGRLLCIITPSYYILFLMASLLSNLSITCASQSPLIIAMEISHPDGRGRPSILQQITWSAGIGFLPFLMWLTGDWIFLLLLTTLPAIVYFLIFTRYLIESPRWLLNRGKITRCIEELEKIAKINKTTLPEDLHKTLAYLPKNTERSMGYLSLFSHWRIAKNTICSAFCITALHMGYYILILNVGSLGENPLLNFFLQGIVELPGYIVSKFSGDYFGRRWTHVSAFVAAGLGCIPLLVCLPDANTEWLVTAVAVFLKFTIAVAFYALNLQAYEFYPTCLRQTGITFSGISSNVFAILVGYIVHLGTSIDRRVPYLILSTLFIISAMCGFLLPETLHHKLPDTIEESCVFGKDQKYWSFPRRQQKFEPVKT